MACRVHRLSLSPADDGARADNAGARVAADRIRELGGLRDIPQREIGALSRRDRPAVREAERARRVLRRAGERFGGRHPEQRAREVQHQHERRDGRGARIAVGRDGDRHAMRAQRRDRRQSRLAQHVERAGQQYRDGTGARHRGDTRLARVFEVISGQRAEFGCERRAARVRELVGVQLDRQPVRACRREYAARLVRRERDPFAERIDRVGEALARRRGDHLAADEVDVVAATARVLRRHRVRGEERRAHVDADLRGDRTRRAQDAALACDVEPIARLDLDGRHATGSERCEPRATLSEE